MSWPWFLAGIVLLISCEVIRGSMRFAPHARFYLWISGLVIALILMLIAVVIELNNSLNL